MKQPVPRLLAVCLLIVAVIAYLAALTFSPVYLLNDEVFSALQAHRLATTGRSFGGDLFPVYFRGLEFPPGRDPIPIYATAIVLELLPLSEFSVRLPTAVMGVVGIVLVYIFASRVTSSPRFGLLAAAMLASTPAYYIHSRIGTPSLWPLPFLAGWLIGLERYATTQSQRALFAGMLCLGLAAMSYFGTAVVVPLYLAGAIVWLHVNTRTERRKISAIALGGFLLPLTAVAYWHVLHPERWRELVEFYSSNATLQAPGRAGQPLPGLLNFQGIQERVTAYWNYFDPTFLFLAGDKSLRYSTARSGVFLAASAVFLPLGVIAAIRGSGLMKLVAYCFFCSPVIGALQGTVQIARVLPMVLFGSILSALGARALVRHPAARVRKAAAVLMILAGLQVAVFLADYFGHYRLRSGWSRGGNLRGAFEEVVHASHERDRPVVYLSETIPNADRYWWFYSAALGAATLRDRAVSIAPGALGDGTVPNGALLVCIADETPPPPWRLRRRIYELDGPTFYAVYEYRDH